MGLIKNAFFAIVSSNAQNRTLFLPQVNSEKVDLIVHGKMTFLFTTEYVKISSSSKCYANGIC